MSSTTNRLSATGYGLDSAGNMTGDGTYTYVFDTNVKPTYAYNLVEITKILEALEGIEPARTVVATAAFSGLRKSEIRGLRWADLRDGQLHVTRNVWETVIQERKLKTAASRGAVSVIPRLAKILEAHRNGFADDAFIFAGPKFGLDLKNLANRVVIPRLKKKKIEWHGDHSFRRDLGTNLYHLGVPDKIIQAILRHADLATTMKRYVKPMSPDVRAAMGQLSRVLNGMSKRKKKR